jgi:hypothetical protein
MLLLLPFFIDKLITYKRRHEPVRECFAIYYNLFIFPSGFSYIHRQPNRLILLLYEAVDCI